MHDRRYLAREMRVGAAEAAYVNGHHEPVANGEEHDSAGRLAVFTKTLQHDAAGEVNPSSYASLYSALCSRDWESFERIQLANGRKLVNPQAGLAFDLQGPDGHSLAIPPAPRMDSSQNTAEMAELYWMALLRDIRFTDFASNPLVATAATDLSQLKWWQARGGVTPATIFRGDTKGDRVGPYVSQFLLKDVDFGTLRFDQRQDTVAAGQDFMTKFDDWLAVQNGAVKPAIQRDFANRRYIQTPRDLAHYVHFDALHEAYFNACLILLSSGAKFDSGNPYLGSTTQEGFGTFGGPHILSLVTEVATRALKAVWYQKWFVHRRLRPEAFGGRIHVHKSALRDYSEYIDSEILNAPVLQRVKNKWGSYLLPQAFPEGSPAHPAYGAGHATVAGACVTILKAWFDEGDEIQNPVVPSGNGKSLVPYSGAKLKVGNELNKLAANISSGRNMGGVHWRTDFTESVKLGEAVAIGILREHKLLTNETSSLSLTRFDGTGISI